MRKKLSGLSAKLIASVLLLSVLLCGAISYMGYREFTRVLEAEYNRSAYEIAETARTYINADKLGHYLETGEVDEEYLEIQAMLDKLVVSTDSYLIYVVKLTDDYSTSTYIYDSVHPDTGFSRYELGYTAQDMDPAYRDEVAGIMTTGERSAVYFYSYSAASGAHTTAGIAVEDSAGNIVALLCVEKAMTALDEARRTYVFNVLGITLAAVAAFLAVYIVFLRRQVVSPILTITREAQRFAEDNVAQLEILDRIKKRDEIGVLARVIAKTLIKNHAQAGMEPAQVFETVNNQLCENNEAGMFVTAFLGVLDIRTGRFTYVNAGHNPPLVSLGGGGYNWLKSRRGFVLAGMEDMHYKQQDITLAPGDSLFLYTDGVTEALNGENELYSEARLLAFFNQGGLSEKPLAEQLRLLHADIAAFASGAEQADDITMLLLHINETTGRDENG